MRVTASNPEDIFTYINGCYAYMAADIFNVMCGILIILIIKNISQFESLLFLEFNIGEKKT
jgi:hypothetical protein